MHEAAPFRILVIANEAVDGRTLRDLLAAHADRSRTTEVLVVCPALNSRLRFWVSDVDRARRAAAARLRASLAGLGGEGIEADGSIGDSDPVQAIEDGLRVFAADELVLVTHGEEDANWVEHGLLERARRQFGEVPIVHLVASEHPLHEAA
jgi:hypothetical protein